MPFKINDGLCISLRLTRLHSHGHTQMYTVEVLLKLYVIILGGSFKGRSNMEEIFGIPSWTANKTHDASDLFILSESLNIVNRRLSCKQTLNSGDERSVLESTSQGFEVQPAYNVAGRSRYAASSHTKHSLYQQRKHSWRSRRPVQCPNCQKIITMAYNLKSHLSTCLKRNGLRSKTASKYDC